MTGNVSSPGIGSCWPSAIVRGTSIRTRSPAASERWKSSPASGSTPITRVSRRQAGDRGRAARQQAAAADGDEQDVERAAVLEQLERRRPLAGHHALVVVGVHRDQPALLDQRGEQRLAVLPVAVEEHDLGAVAAGRRELPGRCVVGHQDHRRDLVQPRGERQRLGVVAGGHGRDAARALGGRHRGHRVVRAAELERAHALEVLGLQQDARRARRLVERAAGDHRSPVRDPGEPPRGGLDIVERDHGVEESRSLAAGSRTSVRPRRRATSCRPWRAKAGTTSSGSSPSRPEMIRRSGTRVRFAATSSSSGRTRLASTVGACGPPWRTSQRETSTLHAVGRRAGAGGVDRFGIEVAGEHRRPAELRRRDREHAAAAAPVGEGAVRRQLRQQLERQAGRRVRARPERLPRVDHDVQRALARRLPRRPNPQRADIERRRGSCASSGPSRRAARWC